MGSKIQLDIGKKFPKTIDMPDVKDMVYHAPQESLLTFGVIYYQGVAYRQVYGIGVVWKIKHSEKYDCVYMKFGNPKELRKIIVIDNHSRRQIMTLKRGQIAHYYGYAKVCHFERKDKSKTYTKWILFALGFQGWYVPRAIDIKREYQDNNDLEDMNVEEEESLKDFIDQFDMTGEIKI